MRALHSVVLGAIDPIPLPFADDLGWEDDIVQDSVVDVGEGSGPGPLLRSVDLSPSGLNLPGGGQENLPAEVTLKLGDELLVGVPHDFQAWVRDIDQQDRLGLLANHEVIELDHLLDEQVAQ